MWGALKAPRPPFLLTLHETGRIIKIEVSMFSLLALLSTLCAGKERMGTVFEVGDQVCYPMHGVGVIEAIEERTVLGATASYYVLRFLIGKMTALVPVESAERVGLRYVVSAEECERVLRFLQEEPCPENENWNKRYRENYEKLRGGDIYDVADVVKCLCKRDAERSLSAGERKMLSGARQVLLAELAAASGRDVEDLFLSIGM